MEYAQGRCELITIDSDSEEVGNSLEIMLERCFPTYLMMGDDDDEDEDAMVVRGIS